MDEIALDTVDDADIEGDDLWRNGHQQALSFGFSWWSKDDAHGKSEQENLDE